MFFHTFVLAIFASLVAFANAANSCPAGSILGIYAMCGSFPVDCGSGLCCLSGQTCVKGGCTDSKLTDDSGKVLTVNAACYGTFDHMTPPASVITSAPASFVTDPSTISTPAVVNVGQSATGTGSGAKSTGLPVSNGATSSFPSQTAALLLSAVAVVAFWL